MSDPSGFLSANEPKHRNSPGCAVGTSAGAATGAGDRADAAGVPGAGTRAQVRPFTGFVRERAAYERLKLELRLKSYLPILAGTSDPRRGTAGEIACFAREGVHT